MTPVGKPQNIELQYIADPVSPHQHYSRCGEGHSVASFISLPETGRVGQIYLNPKILLELYSEEQH